MEGGAEDARHRRRGGGADGARRLCAHVRARPGYALAFSTRTARRAYHAGERWVNAALAGVFAYAGVRMLIASQAR